jgi:predicted RNase H-like HicB family nuclease
MRYAIVIEKAEGNHSAYVPDLPGCVATGATVAEVESQIREAFAFHVEGMRDDGLPIPAPSSQVEYIDVALVEDWCCGRDAQPFVAPDSGELKR